MKITGVTSSFRSRFLNLFDIHYKDKTGSDKHWMMVSRAETPKCISNLTEPADAVVIVAYHADEKKLVLIREFRVPLGGYQYGFSAGIIDPGESVETSAARELKEETGLILGHIRCISPPVYSSSGLTDESVSMVYAECNGTPTNKGTMDSEDIETLLVSREDIKTLLSDKKNKFDVKTWIYLNHFIEAGWSY